MPMDHTNRRILDLLQEDARISYADLGRKLGRAESTIRERVAALERRGVIRGYRARVDPALLGLGARAFVRASFDLGRTRELERGLKAIPEVRHTAVTTGSRPLLIELAARDLDDLERVLEERLAPLQLDDISVEVLVRELVPERPYRTAAPEWLRPRLDGETAPVLPLTGPGLERPQNGTPLVVGTAH